MNASTRWAVIIGISGTQLILGLIMLLAKAKGLALPCGIGLGCANAIHHSPKIIGIPLTTYAVAYPVALLGLLAMSSLWPGSQKVSTALRLFAGFGAGVALLSNGYGYVIKNELCTYCALYGVLVLIGCALILNTPHEAGSMARQPVLTALTLVGLGATGSFGWLKYQLSNGRMADSVHGLPIDEVLGQPVLGLGDLGAKRQVVMFYSPSCGSCKDELGRLSAELTFPYRLGIRLRATPISGSEEQRRVAAAAIAISRANGLGAAIRYLRADTDTQAVQMKLHPPQMEDLLQVDRDRAVANALGLRQTPACLRVESGRATIVPCGSVP